MGTTREQLIRLGNVNKELREPLRKVIAHLDKSASGVTLTDRFIDAKSKFATDVFASLKRKLPQVFENKGVTVDRIKQTGTFELQADVMMATVTFALAMSEEKVGLMVGVSRNQDMWSSVSSTSTPEQVAEALLSLLDNF